MPPQNNTTNNQVPPNPGQNPSQQPVFSVDSLQKNKKFMETIKTFAIYGTILYVVNVLAGMLVSMFGFSEYYSALNIPALIMAIIVGIITMVIAGAVFYFLYEPIHNWVKRTPFLSKYIHDMFTLFWKPFIVITVIFAIFALVGMLGLGAVVATATYGHVAGFGGLFIGWLISLVVQIAVYYWYAKQVSAKLSPFYPW